MDLFKEKGMKMATITDWTCKRYCKRAKGDTRRIHKKARNELKSSLIKELKEGGVS